MFKLYGQLAEVSNTVEAKRQPPAPEAPDLSSRVNEDVTRNPTHLEFTVDLSAVEDAITDIYNSLPLSMTFSSEK